MEHELYHHGILGQKWGVRRFQNEDGSYTPAGLKRREKKDSKWIDRNYKRVYSKAYNSSKKELNRYAKKELNKTYKKESASYVNAYNRKMAELMTESVENITAPSGRVVRFVAKRGEVGVHMALADKSYDMTQLKNGLWASGRVAYKKKTIDSI